MRARVWVVVRSTNFENIQEPDFLRILRDLRDISKLRLQIEIIFILGLEGDMGLNEFG